MTRGPAPLRYDASARARVMLERLKPCPFCGAPARWVERRHGMIAIACGGDDCFISPDTMALYDAASVLIQWQGRRTCT